VATFIITTIMTYSQLIHTKFHLDRCNVCLYVAKIEAQPEVNTVLVVCPVRNPAGKNH